MRKLLFVLALFSAPAIAQEDPIIAKVRAELEAMKAANRANEQKVFANNDALIKKYQEENAKVEAEYGPLRRRPGPVLHTYVYRGHYIGHTIVCIRNRCY